MANQKYGRIIRTPEAEKQKSKIKCWALWFLDTQKLEHLLGCYPSSAEAHEAQQEEFAGRKRAGWRFVVEGIPQNMLEQLG